MKKILVIEDNQFVRENIVEILQLSGYDAMAAENGKIGVEIALKESPHLILCDVMMPELDGFGVLHILGRNQATAQIPFIFLTAKTEKSDFRKGMNLGADDYLTKPFDDVELLNAVEVRLKKSDAALQNKTHKSAFLDEKQADQALQQLTKDKMTQFYRRKDIIFLENQLPRSLFYVISGKIKTFNTNEEGKEYVINIYKEGDFFGYPALIKNEKYTESAAALEAAEIAFIPKEDFLSLLHANLNVSNKLIKILASNILEKEKQLLHLAYNSVRKRVAEALLLLHHRYEMEGYAEIVILRDDLAGLVGTAKESVIRTLSDFKEEKLIRIKSGTITILSLKKLEEMPN